MNELFLPPGAKSPLCERLRVLYADLAAGGLLDRDGEVEAMKRLHPDVQLILERLEDLATLIVDIAHEEATGDAPPGEDETRRLPSVANAADGIKARLAGEPGWIASDRGHWLRAADALDRACLAVLDGPEEPDGLLAIETIESFVMNAAAAPERGVPEGFDRFGWYRSFHDAPVRWGIYVDLDELAVAARGRLAWAEATTVFAALVAAVLHHEWHHVVEDVWIAERELASGSAAAAPMRAALALRPSRRINEALADAEAWSRTARHRSRLLARFGDVALRSFTAAFAGPRPHDAYPRFVRSDDASSRRCAGAVRAWLRLADSAPADGDAARAFLSLRDGPYGTPCDAVPVRLVTASPDVLTALDVLSG